jgi:peptide deformylase
MAWVRFILWTGITTVISLFIWKYFLTRNSLKNNKIVGNAMDRDNKLELKNIVHDMDILRTKCIPVREVDARILKNLDHMLEILHSNGGIGLAANQVGLTERIIVIDLQENGVSSPIYIINPEIVKKSEKTKFGPEGCLSIPLNERSDVERSVRLKIKYLDREEKEVSLEAEGLLAICLQHEIDHLNGILYIDHLPKGRRDFVLEKAKSNIERMEKIQRKMGK